MRASITEIGRYEGPREEDLPGFGVGLTIDAFQIAGIRYDVTGVIEECSERFNRLGSKAL